MSLKATTSEFFTTISLYRYLTTLWIIFKKIFYLRFWNHAKKYEYFLRHYLKSTNSKIISFYNWRSALYHCLKILKLKKTDEVIVSWYTCVSVSNVVIQSWAKIKYCDITKANLWLDIKYLKKIINKNTKVIIIQHTFWKAANIIKIKALADKHNIILIEDCAHSIWTLVNKKNLWTFGDFSIFSTWRDKVISSVSGWFLLINNKKYFKYTKKIRSKLIMPSRTLTLRNLMYNIIGFEAYISYNIFWLWKIIMFLSRKLKLITDIITLNEKNCKYKNFNLKLPNSLAILWIKDLWLIDFYNINREEIAKVYDKMLCSNNFKPIFKNTKWMTNNYYRYPILVKNIWIKERLIKYMKKHNIILWSTWSWINIVPLWTNLKHAHYSKWSCLNAERLSSLILTLPNHYWINIKQVEKIIKLLNNFENNA
jgi:dTDP-4-amino-4,6-dideoxygalactose transaminase